MDNDLEIKTELLMLRHVTGALWANFIANSGGDVVATAKRVAADSLADLDGMYERLTPGPALHPTIQGLLHHEEGFWKSVLEQVEGHRRARRQP